jgi:cobalt-zinc-cadmium efflux system outer membrane protein
LAVLLVAAGCASVKPEPDYRRAAASIRERTGAEQVYDPQADGEVRARVAALLDGGLSVDEAVNVAFLNNAAFQSHFLEIGASRADVVQSGLLQNPVLAISGRMPSGGGRVNLSFSLAQEMADLWQIPVRKKIAKEQLERTVSDVVREAVDLQAVVKRAAYALLAAQEALAVTDESRALLQRAQELTQHRFEAGEATALDLRLVKSDALDLELRRVTQEKDVAAARIDLAKVLGLSRYEGDWDLTGSLPDPGEAIPDDKALLARAAERRIDLQLASLDVAAAEDEVAERFRSILPSLNLGVEGERPELRGPRSRNFAPIENNEFIKGPGYTPQEARLDAAHMAGAFLRDRLAAKRDREFEKQQAIDLLLGPSLDVTLPVWDRNKAQIAKARIVVEQKRKDLQDKLDAAAQEVERAAAAVRSAQDAVRMASEKGIPQAQETLDTARDVYEAGEESILALTAAQQALVRQREARATALGEYAQALADLEQAVGGPLRESEARHD